MEGVGGGRGEHELGETVGRQAGRGVKLHRRDELPMLVVYTGVKLEEFMARTPEPTVE